MAVSKRRYASNILRSLSFRQTRLLLQSTFRAWALSSLQHRAMHATLVKMKRRRQARRLRRCARRCTCMSQRRAPCLVRQPVSAHKPRNVFAWKYVNSWFCAFVEGECVGGF